VRPEEGGMGEGKGREGRREEKLRGTVVGIYCVFTYLGEG